jgi:hypothetical protein
MGGEGSRPSRSELRAASQTCELVVMRHRQVQRLEVVEDVHDPAARSLLSISSTSRSNVNTGFSCMAASFRAPLPEGLAWG